MKIKKGYSYDDVLLIPKKSNIHSREDVDISVDLGQGIKLKNPITGANMANVCGPMMAAKLADFGSLAILHRFTENRIKEFDSALKSNYSRRHNIGVSIGLNDNEFDFLDEVVGVHGCKIVCVDVAHGHHERCLRQVEKVAIHFPDCLLIAGNVATAEGAYDLWSAGANVIKAGIGPGCFAAGTRILMSNGFYKNIEEVKPGDKVINKNGKPVKVLNAFCTGTKNVSKIRNSIHFQDTYVTPDHKYWIGDLNSVSKNTVENQGYVKVLEKKTRTGDSKFKWQEIGQNAKIALLMPKRINFELNKTFKIEILKRDGGNGLTNIKNKVDFILKPSYELGYLFGTFLGGGHANCVKAKTKIGSVRWYFGLEEMHIAEQLQKCYKKITKRSLKIQTKKNIIVCTAYNKPLADFLFTFGKKTEKHLPENLLVSNKKYLMGLLHGLIYSDGSVSERLNLTNTSIKIIELFNIISHILTGVFPNNQKKKITTGNLKGANIKNFNQPYLARMIRTGKKRLSKKYQISKLLEYTETKLMTPVYDLTVDCETHSFIANNAIVHNSLCSTRIETGNGVPQLTALEDIYIKFKGYENPPKIISDGGMKSAGDVVKSLCFSHAVMLGNMLAGTDEAPGEIITINGMKYKKYAGSSTHKSRHVEGVVGLVPVKGPVEQVITKILEGLRSGLSYQGAKNLAELREDPEFIEISNSGLIESRPHDVLLI